MRRRAKRFYPPGLHLALRTETGYRPAMVVQDGSGSMVKVRYTAHGTIQEHWSIGLIWCHRLGPAPSTRR